MVFILYSQYKNTLRLSVIIKQQEEESSITYHVTDIYKSYCSTYAKAIIRIRIRS
jgi:hypothetical protein